MESVRCNLVADVGNTRTKIGIFRETDLIAEYASPDENVLFSIIKEHNILHSIVSYTGEADLKLEKILESNTIFFKLTDTTKIPFTNHYKTPKTLGKDRIAAIAGAISIFPNKDILVLDAGTCLTIDFVNKANEYKGGAISPGYEMRLQAMHSFTHALPLVKTELNAELIGTDTETCMLSGAFNGMLNEINEWINRYEELYPSLQTVICGGNASIFGKHIKKPIFAAPQLVLTGLNQILKLNAQ